MEGTLTIVQRAIVDENARWRISRLAAATWFAAPVAAWLIGVVIRLLDKPFMRVLTDEDGLFECKGTNTSEPAAMMSAMRQAVCLPLRLAI